MNYCKPYKHIPNTLRDHRITRGLSQQDVAQLLGLKDNTLISRWEKGETFPNIINIIKLCELYQVSFQDIFRELIVTVRHKQLL